MSDHEDDIRLRDQFAIAAMQALVQHHQPLKTFILTKGDKGWEAYKNDSNETKEQYLARLDEKIERIATVAYKIADAMRKTRLASFK